MSLMIHIAADDDGAVAVVTQDGEEVRRVDVGPMGTVSIPVEAGESIAVRKPE